MLRRQAAAEALYCAYETACYELEDADIEFGEDVQDMLERLCENLRLTALCTYLASEAANYKVS